MRQAKEGKEQESSDEHCGVQWCDLSQSRDLEGDRAPVRKPKWSRALQSNRDTIVYTDGCQVATALDQPQMPSLP